MVSFAILAIVGSARDAKTQPAGFNPGAGTSFAAHLLPTAPKAETAPTAKSMVIASGTFVSGEHPTQGRVQIVHQNGKRILQLNEQFRTSTSGPDLVVALHRSANVIGETTPPAYPLKSGSYIVLAPLKKYRGTQSYTIPDNINLKNFRSAVIWCRQFNATFGAATLKPAAT